MSVVFTPNPAGLDALLSGQEMEQFLQKTVEEIAENLNHKSAYGIDTILQRIAEDKRPVAVGSVVPEGSILIGIVAWDGTQRYGQYIEDKSKKEPDKLVGNALLDAGFTRA